MNIVTAALLSGIPHGITTRDGGVSLPPFDTLNLGGAVGDDPAHVAANWSRVSEATGLAFARVRQVHGNRVAWATATADTNGPREEADAIVSQSPGLAACVFVADCVPVLIADPRFRIVVAVHAGWRGTLAGVAREAVWALCAAHGSRPEELLVAIGPSIGPCCYQVSADLAQRFRQALGADSIRLSPNGVRVDLWRANELILQAVGVPPARIETLGRCTACEAKRFFSHRRDHGRTGRQLAFIAPPR